MSADTASQRRDDTRNLHSTMTRASDSYIATMRSAFPVARVALACYRQRQDTTQLDEGWQALWLELAAAAFRSVPKACMLL
jgi:hypothetical protein